jgi:hypothetical protein
VRINPFALSASVRHLAVKEHDGAANVFGFDELSVNVAYSSLWRRALLVEALKLARPYVRIVRNDDKTYNVQDLVEAFTRPAQPEPTSAPPRFAFSTSRSTTVVSSSTIGRKRRAIRSTACASACRSSPASRARSTSTCIRSCARSSTAHRSR